MALSDANFAHQNVNDYLRIWCQSDLLLINFSACKFDPGIDRIPLPIFRAPYMAPIFLAAKKTLLNFEIGIN